METINISILFTLLANTCVSYKILAIFPFNGRSHHILFSSLVEELAMRQHDVTVVNYFPMKRIPNLRQISLQNNHSDSGNIVNMEEYLRNLPAVFVNVYRAYDMARLFKVIANSNCDKLVSNKELRDIITLKLKYDLVIVEQFVTDCALAFAHELNAPAVGITAHILMPWTYSRLGAPNNPAFVSNAFFITGTKPHLWNRIQSALINFSLNAYYRYVIQGNDQEIVNRVFPEVPDLESLGRKMSLIMLNQYFPLTGTQLYGANVIEIGGMHIKQESVTLTDQDVQKFLDNSENGVVYISFGTVASNFSRKVLNVIIKVIENTDMQFIWKMDNISNWVVPQNALVNKWVQQPAILCHSKVIAFITHSGMLSTSEAMHCGVPVVSVPLFGDQFTNSASAVESGLGISVDIVTLDENILGEALKTVLQDRYQERAKQLSFLWRDRPVSPMNAAIFWIEHVARHKGVINMKPPTVHLDLYQYLLLDVYFILALFLIMIIYILKKVMSLVVFFGIKIVRKMKGTKKD